MIEINISSKEVKNNSVEDLKLKIKEEIKIKNELSQNIGTTQHIQIPFSNYVFTDGVNNMIELCKCHWLISDTAIQLSHDKELQKPFLLLKIEVNDKNEGVVTLREDSNKKPIFEKKYNYTDFPLKEYEIYIVDNVFLLKSEY